MKKIKDIFKGWNEKLMENTSMDTRGMLSLYEASQLAFEGEDYLDKAREFMRLHLKHVIADVDKKVGVKVEHALELPSHHRMPRLEAKWNIEMYDDKQSVINQMLHKLAILDFNKVQSLHQRELLEVARYYQFIMA